MGIVIDLADRIGARTPDAILDVPQWAGEPVYPDSNSVSDDIRGLAEHVSAMARLFQRDLLGPEQIANNLARLTDCATRAAARTQKLESELLKTGAISDGPAE